MKNIVQIKNLVKEYNGTRAVKGISFNIRKGEVFGFLGPNGAGKTTTINSICQLATPTKGKITVNGYDIDKDYIKAKMEIGLSPQEMQMDVYFTIWEILVYQGGYFGVPKKQAEKKARELLEEFNLWEKRKKTIKELSGGMKRKLSIAKAMIHNPKILILDEPTAGLDVDTRYELWDLIKKLKKQGITIILTTHYIEEAEKLSDRIGIINQGELVKLDHTKNIIEKLSQNIITIYLEKTTKIKEITDLNFEQHKEKIIIQTKKKDQSKNLNKALQSLEKQGIEVKNFQIDQDNLENIFRRIIYEK